MIDVSIEVDEEVFYTSEECPDSESFLDIPESDPTLQSKKSLRLRNNLTLGKSRTGSQQERKGRQHL